MFSSFSKTSDGNAGEAAQRVQDGIPIGRPPTIELRNQHATYAATWLVNVFLDICYVPATPPSGALLICPLSSPKPVALFGILVFSHTFVPDSIFNRLSLSAATTAMFVVVARRGGK